VLKKLGSRHVMVVHAVDGLDEISIASDTLVAELKDGKISLYQLTPEQFALPRNDLSTIRVDGSEESLAMIQSVLANEATPARDIVALNAGAAIYVAGISETLEAGVEKALAVIASGEAARRLEQLVTLSQSH